MRNPHSFPAASHDPGYQISVCLPRTMNRLANMAALAVFFGLLPVSLAVWKGLL